MIRKFGTVSGIDSPPKGLDLGLSTIQYATGTASVPVTGGSVTGLTFAPNVIFATAGGGAWWFYNKGTKIKRSANDTGTPDVAPITNGFYVSDPAQGSGNFNVTYYALLVP